MSWGNGGTGGGGWGNPVVAGTAIERAAFQSPNFVHGSTGWSINQDGSAEFHDIVIPEGSGGAVVTIGPTAPSSPHVGDLWYDSNNGMQLHQWNGTTWALYQLGGSALSPTAGITSGQVSFTARDINGITTTISATAPTGAVTGDLWINSGNGYQIEQWNGSAWVAIQWDASKVIGSGSITQGLLNGTITSRSLGGITTTIAGTAPTGAVAGDIWIDSANGYQMNQYSGTAWTPIQWTASDVLGSGSITQSLLSGTITARSLGGITTSITGTAPTSPVAGDIWIDSANGYQLQQYSGSAWAPIAWDASKVISATTIVGGLIAGRTIAAGNIIAGTLTSNEIAAGTITAANLYSGTVQADLIQAANIAASTITGGLIAAGTITAGNLYSGTVQADLIQAANIATGTITATQIHTGTITASLLAAGIVVAGIVDSTTIKTATLIGSTILGYATGTERGPYTANFETGTDSWTGSNATIAQSNAWSSQGTYSLLVTNAGAAGQWQASAPLQACSPYDPVSASADVHVPGASALTIGINIDFYDSTQAYISTTGGGTTSVGAGATATLTVSANAPSNAAYYRPTVADPNTSTSGTQFAVDNVQCSGNLAFSAAAAGGTDAVGNTYDQGIEINGVAGLTQAFSVEDAWGQATLAFIDPSGNISGQNIYGGQDIFLAGQSLTSDVLPNLAIGSIARSYIPAASLPYPSTGITTETGIYELDVTLTMGRSYLFMLEDLNIVTTGSPGRITVRVRATTDGTTPTTSSGIFMESFVDLVPTNRSFATIPSMTRFYQPGGSGTVTMKMLVTLATSTIDVAGTTYSTAPTAQFAAYASSPWTGGQAGLAVIDQGLTVPNTGTLVGTASGQNITQSWTATHTYSYQGDDAGSALFDTDGKAYQGGDISDTFNGDMKTWILFDYSAIATALSGATINSVKLTLNNNHCWYASGMTLELGWDTKTSFGSSATNPSAHIMLYSASVTYGATQTFNIGTQFGTAFQSGGATTLVLFTTSTNLQYYGYFAGAAQSGPPVLTINYTT